MKGATAGDRRQQDGGGISTHAPVKGATLPGGRHGTPAVDFNPRTREGCDDEKPLALLLLLPISTHAPVKGATSKILGLMDEIEGFQPTHP